jgi:hypothetical protein
VEYFGYNLVMPRPRKAESDRKSTDLRIPLTEAQKEMIARAARLDDVDMAAWARPILIEAARVALIKAGVNDHQGQGNA